MIERQAAIEKLAKDSKLGFGTGGEVKELAKILWTDEQPMKMARGTYHGGNGIIVATDRRLIFIDKGLIGLKNRGLRLRQDLLDPNEDRNGLR